MTTTPLSDFKLPQWTDLPDLEIYMDQLVSLGNRYLTEFAENMITPAMVNSYVKKELISRPVKKKYNQRHIAELLMVSLFKSVYSLDVTKQVIHLIFNQSEAETAYAHFATLFNSNLQAIDGKDSPALNQILQDETGLNKIEEFTIRAVIYQLLGQQEILHQTNRAKQAE